MPLEQMISQILTPVIAELAFLALISGALGAALMNVLFDFIDRQIQKAKVKRQAKLWKERQDMAKAEQGAQLRCDDVAGRASETRSGSAA